MVQDRLVHYTINTTLDTYSHVAPGFKPAATTAFVNILIPETHSTLDKQLAGMLQS